VTEPRLNQTDDYAELLASMSIAIGLAVTKGTPAADLESVLAQASHNMAGRLWQITAARKLRISPWMWIDRPWHCWQIRKLANELLDSAEDGPTLQAKVAKLGRYSAMVEFGVNVNEYWYRRLRGAVVTGVTTHAELRSLLRKPTVWWGAKQDGPSSFFAWIRTLLNFGRPPDGELLIKQFHPITRVVLMIIFLTSAFGFSLGVGLVFRLVSSPHFSHDRLLGLLDFTVAMFLVSLASWWLGPSSTGATRRLEEIFNSP
jgi:hypothetical protein